MSCWLRYVFENFQVLAIITDTFGRLIPLPKTRSLVHFSPLMILSTNGRYLYRDIQILRRFSFPDGGFWELANKKWDVLTKSRHCYFC